MRTPAGIDAAFGSASQDWPDRSFPGGRPLHVPAPAATTTVPTAGHAVSVADRVLKSGHHGDRPIDTGRDGPVAAIS